MSQDKCSNFQFNFDPFTKTFPSQKMPIAESYSLYTQTYSTFNFKNKSLKRSTHCTLSYTNGGCYIQMTLYKLFFVYSFIHRAIERPDFIAFGGYSKREISIVLLANKLLLDKMVIIALFYLLQALFTAQPLANVQVFRLAPCYMVSAYLSGRFFSRGRQLPVGAK